MASELCMNCFSVKGQYEVCPYCGHVEGTPPKQPHYLTPGTILGNHFIVGTAIGAGGFGITYKCFDTTLGVIVAVKEFFPVGLVNRAPGECNVGLLSGDKREQYQHQLKRFLMEAQSIAKFGKAKDIVNVFDFFEENNTAYIIMEYIDGVLLKDYLDKQGKMSPGVAMNIIMPIINAVKKIHANGIIHRDISPDNIFISSEDSVKVFDFGAAQLNDSTDGAGEKVIKVGYSAPEQYREKCRQGFYTDIYSIGAILYQMVTGIKPMESTEREFKDELKSPAQLGVEIGANVDRAIMEAMAVQPELRFQSVQQLEDALNSKRIAEYPEKKLKKRKRRRNWVISLSSTLVLAVGVIIGLFATVLKPENVIFDSTLTPTTITVWVENETQKEKIETVRDTCYSTAADVESTDRTAAMLANNKDITINVVNITEEDADATMDQKLKEAKQKGEMPDMFLTDHVAELDEYHTVSLEDNVYAAIDPDDYLYMTQYTEYFSDFKEMPTGIDTLLYYAYQFKENKKNSLINSIGSKQEQTDTIELSEIVSANTADGRNEFTTFSDESLIRVCLLQNSEWFNEKEGTILPDDSLVSSLEQFTGDIKTISDKKTASKNKEGKVLLGNSRIDGVGYHIVLNSFITNDATQTAAQKNELAGYTVSVVTQNGKMLVEYADKYAISAESDENKQIACMRLLWILLGESAQDINFRTDGIYPFPINKNSFNLTDEEKKRRVQNGQTSQDYFDCNPKYECFSNLVGKSSPCLPVGKGSGKLNQFYDGLVADGFDIQEYCKAYSSQK